MKKSANSSAQAPESLKEIAEKAGPETGEVWQLRLYVADRRPIGGRFRQSKKDLRATSRGRYNIEVVDLVKHPQLAAGTRSLPYPPWCGSCRNRCAKLWATSATPNAP